MRKGGKILVTGATGFIGQYVITQLLECGYEVIASSANEAKAKESSWFEKVRYFPLDLSTLDDKRNYYTYFGQPDALIHLAWEGLPNYKALFHLEDNLPRHVLLLENLIKAGLKDITIVGTCLEYGMQEGALDEEMLPLPGNPYAQAKDQLRQSLERLRVEQPFDFRWIRLFYMYGKGQNPNSLLSQLDRALENNDKVFNMSGGEQLRDYLPVEKVAEYIVRIATQDAVTGIINCCSGRPVSVKEFVEDYLKLKNKHISLNLGFYPYPDYEPMRFWGNDVKLKTILKNE